MEALTENQIEVVRRELAVLERARQNIDEILTDVFADHDIDVQLYHTMRNHLMDVARAEGEIEQAVFGARGAS